jgi:hypothetical protein
MNCCLTFWRPQTATSLGYGADRSVYSGQPKSQQRLSHFSNKRHSWREAAQKCLTV